MRHRKEKIKRVKKTRSKKEKPKMPMEVRPAEAKPVEKKPEGAASAVAHSLEVKKDAYYVPLTSTEGLKLIGQIEAERREAYYKTLPEEKKAAEPALEALIKEPLNVENESSKYPHMNKDEKDKIVEQISETSKANKGKPKLLGNACVHCGDPVADGQEYVCWRHVRVG